MTRLAEPQLSFADLQLRNQGVHLDPLLQGILTFLDDQAPLVEQVRQDLVRGLKNPNTGRGGITPAQTLRSLILMRVKNWDYRELRNASTTALPCAASPTVSAGIKQQHLRRVCSQRKEHPLAETRYALYMSF